jgi:hypothetical protein
MGFCGLGRMAISAAKGSRASGTTPRLSDTHSGGEITNWHVLSSKKSAQKNHLSMN